MFVKKTYILKLGKRFLDGATPLSSRGYSNLSWDRRKKGVRILSQRCRGQFEDQAIDETELLAAFIGPDPNCDRSEWPPYLTCFHESWRTSQKNRAPEREKVRDPSSTLSLQWNQIHSATQDPADDSTGDICRVGRSQNDDLLRAQTKLRRAGSS